MIGFGLFLFSLSVGVLSGALLVARGGPENSLIGLNVATICGVTALVVLDREFGVVFSKDIAFYLILPGVFGVVVVAMLLRGLADG